MASMIGTIDRTAAAPRPVHYPSRARCLAGSLPCVAITLALFVMLLGIVMLVLDGGRACGGFPLCNGGVRPMGETPLLTARLHSNWSHRVFSYMLEIVVLFGAVRVWMRAGSSARMRRASAIAAAAVTAELTLGALLVTSEFPIVLRLLHAVIGVSTLVSLTAWAATDARVRSVFQAR